MEWDSRAKRGSRPVTPSALKPVYAPVRTTRQIAKSRTNAASGRAKPYSPGSLSIEDRRNDMEPQTLAHPPISEAVLQVAISPAASEESIRRISTSFKSDFEDWEQINAFSMGFTAQLGSDASIAPQSQQQVFRGLVGRSRETGRLVNLDLESFSFHQLAPYPGWKVVEPLFERYWKAYREHIPSHAVTRLAIRTVNRIEIPVSEFLPTEYFNCWPTIPAPDDARVGRVYLRSELYHSGLSCGTILQLSSEIPGPSKDTSVFLLDIDVFSGLPRLATDAEIVDRMRTLKDLRNWYFFSSLTAKCLDLFT